MGTAFRDQNPVSILQSADRCRARYRGLQEAFISGHQNRERCQRYIFRYDFGDLVKYLAVRNDHGRIQSSPAQQIRKLTLSDTDSAAAGIQDIPNGLLLGQNQSSFGRSFINRDDEQDQVSFPQQVAHQPLRLGTLSRHLTDLFFQFLNAGLLQGADEMYGQVFFFLCQFLLFPFGQQVFLIHGNDERNLLLLKESDQFAVAVCQSFHPVGYQNSQIRTVQNLPGPAHSLLSQAAFIVETGGINNNYRPKGQQFHGLADRIGCGTFDSRYQGCLLAGHGIYQTGFAGVPAPEEAYMEALRGGSIIHAHLLYGPFPQ